MRVYKEFSAMNFTLKDVCSQFDVYTNIDSYGNGHINDTYLCETEPAFILQRINTNIFTNPEKLMENIFNVTEHIKAKITQAGGDIKRETLSVIKTRDGKNYYKVDDENYFRMYDFVADTVTHEFVENPQQLYNAAKAFGKFQRMLDDFDAEKLYETIVDFHTTPKRVEQLQQAIKQNAANRLEAVQPELEEALKYAKYADKIVNAIADGEVPVRVTHNDTKLNNVLFDAKTDEGICVIDLDTVMPGSALYDFGDALRFGASTGAEDETDLAKIEFDLERFEAFTKGFLEETADCLTKKEIELLPLSALIMTYECGIRFLADYLNGDTYFKIHREHHNLDRARTQLKLVKDIESKLDKMAEIVNKYI